MKLNFISIMPGDDSPRCDLNHTFVCAVLTPDYHLASIKFQTPGMRSPARTITIGNMGCGEVRDLSCSPN